MPEAARVGRVARGTGAKRLIVQTLEAGLSRQWGRTVRVRDMRREELRATSSFRIERLHVTLQDGTPLRVFFKDLNPDNQTDKARAVRAFDLEPSLRELRMYERILSPERFGTLTLYASRWEAARGIYWLLLEDGGPVVLHNSLDMVRWTAAARWAARFHAATRDLPPDRTDFLPRYDAAHYRGCADRVARILPGLEPGERAMVERGLAHFVARIPWLAALPRCVLHGQYFGKNVLVRRRKDGPRVVVIDWETAALGPGTFDLVSLTSGKWTTDQRDAMRAAYVEAYEAATGRRLDRDAFAAELAAVALYQALEWLAWWGPHRSLSRHFANFVRELRGVLDDHFAAA